MARMTKFMSEAAQGLSYDEMAALDAYLRNPNNNEYGGQIYALLYQLENAFPKKGDVVFGRVKHNGASMQAAKVGRNIRGRSYTTLAIVGHNAGNLLKEYRKYSDHFDDIQIARTTLGYAILHPM